MITTTRPHTLGCAWGLAAPYGKHSAPREGEGKRYGKPADWRFRLFFGAGSLRRTAAESQCRAMVDHGAHPQFGNAILGPVRLKELPQGLVAFLDIKDGDLGRRFARFLQRKQFHGMSICFALYPDAFDILPGRHGSLDTMLVHDLGTIREVSFCSRRAAFSDTCVLFDSP
ncbi:MAG TPA: HK97 family phage prohead protease [Pirellulales bacterium]|nr:HK97 family phage prohead protease [Pirellulales bacterium]